jgi:hypothetical protein
VSSAPAALDTAVGGGAALPAADTTVIFAFVPLPRLDRSVVRAIPGADETSRTNGSGDAEKGPLCRLATVSRNRSMVAPGR